VQQSLPHHFIEQGSKPGEEEEEEDHKKLGVRG